MSGRVFALPDLGEGLTEAEVVEWLVAEGDEVVVDQPVVVVETAKATVDVPCPYAGTLTARHGEVGQTIAVGAPLVTVGGGPPGEPTPGGGPALAGAEQYRQEERAGSAPPSEGSGAVLIGYGTSGTGPGGSASRRERRRRRLTQGSPAAAAVAPAAGPVAPEAGDRSPGSAVADGLAVRVISPLVRRLARDHGVDLGALAATAPHGIVRRADVEAALAAATPPSGAGGANGVAAQAGPAPRPVGGSPFTGERVPLTGVRRAIADKLSTSRREIPDATTWVDVDASGLLAARDELRAVAPEAGIGVLALLARICVAALHRFPELNASVDTEAGEIVRHDRVGLGFAAQSPRGLVVPVVHDAHLLSTRELAAALRELTEKAREGRLSPAELTGGTFTLNNYGVFGVDGSTPILNHPEAAMIGVGRIVERPWVVDHELVVRPVTQLGLTFDHRVCDGGSAGGYLRTVADLVERPLAMLVDG